MDTTDQKGLTLAATIGSGAIVKKGAGLLKFTTNPPYAITVENGAFTFGVDATPTITYSAKPGAGTTMSMWYATQATWKGTVVIGDLNAPAALPLNAYGNENSKIVLTGTTGNCYLNGTTTVAAELVVGTNATNVVEFNNGNSDQVGTFNKVSGPGTLKLTAWSGCRAATYVVNTDNFTGTLAIHNAITRDQGGAFTIRIGNIATTGATTAGSKVLNLTQTAVAGATGTVVYDTADSQVNGEAAKLAVTVNGIFVAGGSATIGDVTTYYRGSSSAYMAVMNGGSAGDSFTVFDDAEYGDLDGFEYNEETKTYTMLQMVAQFTYGVQTTKYTTLEAACTEAAKLDPVPTVVLLVALGEQTVPYGWTYNTPEVSETTYGTLTYIPRVAQIVNGDAYVSLADAVAAAGTGATVELLDSIALAESVEIAAGKNVTIDLNGKTITGPAGGYVFANAGEVTITGNGTVTGAGGIAENTASDASVSIASGSYTATGDLFANVEGATIAVSGGTFNQSVADEYLAEGYEVTNNGDGTYGVREDKGWIYAEEGYWNYTGTWSGVDVDPSAEAVTIETNATYMANRPSAGQLVTVAMTLSFDDVNDDASDLGDAKAAVRLAAGETDGTYQFQLYTSDGENKVWTNATVDVTATKEDDYNFVFRLDLTNKTYTASIVSGATTNALSIGESVTEIPFACLGNVAPVQRIEFIGAGSVTSIKGSYEDAEEPAVFVEDEPIALSDDSVQLSADQAAWLNKLGAKSVVSEALATLSSDQFSSAYLLNLDLTDTFTYEFTVSDITVGDSTVEVEVTLTRTGTLVDGKSSINGTLKLMGGATLPASGFVDLHVAPVGDDDFSDGDTATWSFGKGDAKFFQPVIE